MKIEQLTLFGSKADFQSQDLESEENMETFQMIVESITEAFRSFSTHDISEMDSTTRSNMLNNLVVSKISGLSHDKLRFAGSLTNTRRNLTVLNNKYILFFKKFPISNVPTEQDDLIKSQGLDKHVIFVGYKVDDFWTEITSVKLLYYSSRTVVSYSYDLSHMLYEMPDTIMVPVAMTPEDMPTVKVKESAQKKKHA